MGRPDVVGSGVRAGDAVAGRLLAAALVGKADPGGLKRGRLLVSGVGRIDRQRASPSALLRWHAFLVGLLPESAGMMGVALGLDVRRPPASVRALLSDPARLADQIGRVNGVAAFHFCTADLSPGAEWLWPLDLALLDDGRSRALGKAVERLHRRAWVQPIAAGAATGPIELLVYPGTLPQALAALGEAPGLPRVQLVLVLGGLGGHSAPVVGAEQLRIASRADAVCIVACRVRRHRALLDAFLVGLAGDLDADRAFARACLEIAGAPPLMIAGEGAFARARLACWVVALATRMAQPPALEGARGARSASGAGTGPAAGPGGCLPARVGEAVAGDVFPHRETSGWVASLTSPYREASGWVASLTSPYREASGWVASLTSQYLEAAAWAARFAHPRREAAAWAARFAHPRREAAAWEAGLAHPRREAAAWAVGLAHPRREAAAWAAGLAHPRREAAARAAGFAPLPRVAAAGSLSSRHRSRSWRAARLARPRSLPGRASGA